MGAIVKMGAIEHQVQVQKEMRELILAALHEADGPNDAKPLLDLAQIVREEGARPAAIMAAMGLQQQLNAVVLDFSV